MFVSGMFSWLRVPMMITTMLIAIPTGIKVFSWLATMWRGVLELSTPMLFALGFATMFTLGGISGIMLAALPVVIHTDSYFVVAHIHYVLFEGSIFTVFAGVYYWFPKMTGRMYDERLGKIHFWLTFIGFNATFAPMHWIGLEGMPRRVADYADKFADWNLFVSIAAFMLGISTLFFFWNMIVSWKWGPRAPGNPWRAMTLSGRFPHLHQSSTSTRSRRSLAAPTSTARGAVHAVMNGGREEVAVGVGAGHGEAAGGANGHGGNGHEPPARDGGGSGNDRRGA